MKNNYSIGIDFGTNSVRILLMNITEDKEICSSFANVLHATYWSNMPAFREGIDRPSPLLYIIISDEVQTKIAGEK